MRISLRNQFIPGLLAFVLATQISFSQTITSTATGGRWNSTATWVGGVVPTSGTDVIIAGTVIFSNGDGSCRNLTVNAGATLQNDTYYASPEMVLTVNGSVTNNGTIRNYFGSGLALVVIGDVTNNGVWTFNRTELRGSGTQTIAQGAGKMFQAPFKVTATSVTIAASTDLTFAAGFDLNKMTLTMQSHVVTLTGEGANIFNGSVVNAGDIVGKPATGESYPYLDNITYDGSPNLKGRLKIHTLVIMKGNLTVTDTLENLSGYAHPEKILKVVGNIVNNGIIRNYFSNGLALNVTGNITNNGTWAHNRTELSGTADQMLTLGAGKMFEASFSVTDSTIGGIVAGSDLAFARAFNLGKATLDMKNFAITLYSEGTNISNGSVINTKDLIGKPTGGTSYPYLDNITYNGNPTLKGRLKIHTLVVMKGNVTVTDTLENLSGYAHPEKILKIIGDITNNGIIRNYYSNGLTLNVTGNVANNGIWVHNRTELSGTGNHILSLGVGKSFDAAFKSMDSTGMTTAGSNLVLSSWFDLLKSVLDMKDYSLTLTGPGASVTNGVVINTRDLVGRSTGDAYSTPILDNITYSGTIYLKGLLRVNSGTLVGNVTVVDTIQNSSGYAHPEKFLKILGTLTNNGVIRDGGSYGLVLDVSGNIMANKALVNNRVQLAGSGNRTISDTLSRVTYTSTGPNVVLTGVNFLPNLSIAATSKCMLANGAVIYVVNGTLDETLDNWSTIKVTKKPSTSQVNAFFKARVSVLPTSTFDSISVMTYGHQVPATFSNAVRTWYRINRQPTSGSSTVATLTMYYRHDELGNNVESNLQVFFSADSGQSWRQLSTTLNTTRNPDQNYVSLTDATVPGDYLLSSSPDPLSVSPSIVTAVIGRPQVRLGAPNRFTIQMANNSDIPAEDFLLTVNTGTGVRIQSAEFITGDGSKLVLPKDSLFFENEDTTLVFYVLKMAPHEERVFDIIAFGSGTLPKTSSIGKLQFIDPVSITAGAVITWAAWKAGTYVVCKGIDYVGDKLSNSLKLSPADQKRYDDAVKGGIPTELEQHPSKVKVFALKTVSTMVLKKTLDLAPGGVSAVQVTIAVTDNVKKVAPSLRQRIFNWFYKETGLYGVEQTESGNSYQPQVSTVTQKKGQLVRSWDPNLKIGPEGSGDRNHIATTARMTYQILFENKKEATAPAWRVAIVDTLRSEFDPETFQFGRTSHQGAQYNWVMTRTGNIVKWVIEGIELPPNVNPPEGEGWVEFSVMPKSGLASGTALQNRSTITFDVNPPIATNTVVNTLDFTAPTTSMKSLPVKLATARLAVRWTATDGTNGSGVASTTVYQSQDGGPFIAVGTTNADSLVVSIDAGSHKYAFYALTTDNVGNIESLRPATISTDIVNEVVELPIVPMEFGLSQNYPNPFNPSTTIQFSLAAKSRATLKIFDLLGREVATLLDEEKLAGTFAVAWNAARFSSGVYFCRLTAGDFVQIRKLVLMK